MSERMEAWLTSLKDALALAADSKVIFSGGAIVALLSVAGVTPRVGLVRAFTLGWRSYFKKAYPLSVRGDEIRRLDACISSLTKGSYIALIGGKGNGKSCLVDTTLNRRFGVVKISTISGANKNLIVDEVLREITGIRYDLFKQGYSHSARRVLFLYSFLFKLPPTVAISVPDRLSGQLHADLPSAVRVLASDFGLRVIVDGSLNAIPPELLATDRETVFDVGPMTRNQIESIPEFEDFVGFLKTHHLDGPVWKVLGGSPARYLKLKETIDRLSLSNAATDTIVSGAKKHIGAVLSNALNQNVLSSSATTNEIIKLFREETRNSTKISKGWLKQKGYLLENPNKVFHEVNISDRWYIEPVTSAVALIISENIQDDYQVDALLEKLFNELDETYEKVK